MRTQCMFNITAFIRCLQLTNLSNHSRKWRLCQLYSGIRSRMEVIIRNWPLQHLNNRLFLNHVHVFARWLIGVFLADRKYSSYLSDSSGRRLVHNSCWRQFVGNDSDKLFSSLLTVVQPSAAVHQLECTVGNQLQKQAVEKILVLGVYQFAATRRKFIRKGTMSNYNFVSSGFSFLP